MVERKNVAVIGGGVSGLAAAKVFDARGHRVTGFERSHDFGEVWELSRSSPGVQTQSPRDLYRFTEMSMPDEYPEWPKGPQVHADLHAYAAKHGLARLFRFNSNIARMERRSDGRSGWTLTIEEAGRSRREDFDFVAIGTGQFSEKNIISRPGQDEFIARGGRVMHSSEYTDPSIAEGKRVVGLGGSILPQEYRDKLVEADGQYRVYRLSVNPDLPDMGFVGFNSSFCTVLGAEMIANWLVRYADGQLAHQPGAREMQDNIQMMLGWRRKERPAAQIYGGLCSAPVHFKHLDELLADMGIRKRKRANPLAERFSYPNTDAYGTFLASAPEYGVN